LLEDLGRRGYRQILLPPRPSEFFTACRAAARGEAVPAQTSAVAAPVLALAPPQADVISLKKGVQKQVLVVDDSPENRLVIESFLEGLPCRSVSVTSGEEAVETCRQHRFDLILMDIHMPGMDGYATTRALREMERREGRKPAQIVAVTAHSEGQGTAGFKARGFDDYLPKPIDARALGMLVRVADPRTLREPVRRLADRVKLMAPDYLRDRSAELEAVAPTDLGRVGTLAHRIKGNARTFGFAPLGEMGAELEEAARQGNMPAVEAGLTRMREYLRKELSAEKTPS
jgi:CheY-like chemotaxis protein